MLFAQDLPEGVSADEIRADELPTMKLGRYTIYFKERRQLPLWTERTFDLERRGVSFMSRPKKDRFYAESHT